MKVGSGTEVSVYGFAFQESFWVWGFNHAQIHLRLVLGDHPPALGNSDVFFLSVKVFELVFFTHEGNPGISLGSTAVFLEFLVGG